MASIQIGKHGTLALSFWPYMIPFAIPMLAAELPGLTLRSDIAAGAAANTIFRNWLGFLREEAREPAPSRK